MTAELIIWLLVLADMVIDGAIWARRRLRLEALRARPGKWAVADGFGGMDFYETPYIRGDQILIFDRSVLSPLMYSNEIGQATFDKTDRPLGWLMQEQFIFASINLPRSIALISGV